MRCEGEGGALIICDDNFIDPVVYGPNGEEMSLEALPRDGVVGRDVEIRCGNNKIAVTVQS